MDNPTTTYTLLDRRVDVTRGSVVTRMVVTLADGTVLSDVTVPTVTFDQYRALFAQSAQEVQS